MNELFPEIYDTKFIVNHTQHQKTLEKVSFSSSLDILYDLCKHPDHAAQFADIKIKLGLGFESYDMDKPENCNHFHEAGFDAYLTGYCFAKMFYKMGPEDLNKVRNSVNVMKSFKYLKVTEELDPYYNDKAVFMVLSEAFGEDKKEFVYTDILAKVSTIGLGEDLKIIIVNNETQNQALLVLETEDEIKRITFVKKIYSLEKSEGFKVETFDKYIVGLEKERAAEQAAKKFKPNYQNNKNYGNNNNNKNNFGGKPNNNNNNAGPGIVNKEFITEK